MRSPILRRGTGPVAGGRRVSGGFQLVGVPVEERDLVSRAEERGSGVFGDGKGSTLSLTQRLSPLFLHILPGEGEGMAREADIPPREVAVEGSGDAGGVPVRDGALHGEHHGDAVFQETLGEARRVVLGDAAVAGGEYYQRQRLLGGANGVGQFAGGDLQGLAVLGLHLHLSGGAVAREVKDVVAPREEGGTDRVRVVHLQDLYLGVAVSAGGVHGVEDGLKLQFDVQDGIAGLAFVGSADGDEDAKRTRKRASSPGLGSKVAAQQAHAGFQGGEPAAGQAGGLKRDGEEIPVAPVSNARRTSSLPARAWSSKEMRASATGGGKTTRPTMSPSRVNSSSRILAAASSGLRSSHGEA